MTTAAATIIARRQHFVMSNQMIRQWLAAVLTARLSILIGFGSRLGLICCRFADLFVLNKGEVKLIQTFRLRSKPVAIVAVELVLKLLDLSVVRVFGTNGALNYERVWLIWLV